MILAALFVLILLTLAGLPLFLAILGAAALGFLHSGVDLGAIPIEIARLAHAPVLLAIPLFTFAGYLLGHGGSPARLVRAAQGLFGWAPGGLGIVALFSCALFTAITGATGVTIVALGGLLLPALLSQHYEERFALGIVTVGGSLGLQFPPSLPVILYGFVAGVQIERLFVAGFLPGLLLLVIPSIFSLYMGRKWKLRGPRFSLRESLAAIRGAAWEILLPVFVVGGIYGGLVTTTESASLAAAYMLAVKLLVYRELHPLRELPALMVESAKMAAAVLIILGASLSLTSYLVDAFVPMRILEAVEGLVHGRVGFLILLNLFLLLVGCMMDIFSATLIVVPLIAPLASRFGIHPLHLGVIFLANLAIGYNTPPVGLNLFIASGRFQKPVVRIYAATLPFLLLLLLALLLITYWPPLSLYLPSLLKAS